MRISLIYFFVSTVCLLASPLSFGQENSTQVNSIGAWIELNGPGARPYAPDTLVGATLKIELETSGEDQSIAVTLSGDHLMFSPPSQGVSPTDTLIVDVALIEGKGQASFNVITAPSDIFSSPQTVMTSIEARRASGTLIARAPLGLKHCSRAYHEALFSRRDEFLGALDSATKQAKNRDGFLAKSRLTAHRNESRSRATRRAIGAANALQKRRLKDRYLTGNEGAWYLNSFRRDLKQYFDQDYHPGLCSGGQFMVEYLRPLTRTIRERANELQLYGDDAIAALNSELAELEEMVSHLSAAETIEVAEGQGDASEIIAIRGAVPLNEQPERPEAKSYSDLLKSITYVRELLAYVANQDFPGSTATLDAELASDDEAESPASYRALRGLVEQISTSGAEEKIERHRKLFKEAAALLETAWLTGRAAKKVADVQDAIFNAFDAILETSEQECTCIE